MGLSRMLNGPISSMTRPSIGSAARRCASARLGSKPSALELSAGGVVAIQLRAFDRQHSLFCRDTALSGKAADLAAGGEHAMTRHDDRERVAPERLPDRAGCTGGPDTLGDVTV